MRCVFLNKMITSLSESTKIRIPGTTPETEAGLQNRVAAWLQVERWKPACALDLGTGATDLQQPLLLCRACSWSSFRSAPSIVITCFATTCHGVEGQDSGSLLMSANITWMCLLGDPPSMQHRGP